MNTNNDYAAGFNWRRADRMIRPQGRWLRDVVIALTVALMATLLWMAGDAHAQTTLMTAQRKDPGNRFVANNLQLLAASANTGKAIE